MRYKLDNSNVGPYIYQPDVSVTRKIIMLQAQHRISDDQAH